MAAGGVEAVVGHFGFRLEGWWERYGGLTLNQGEARQCRIGLKLSHYIIAILEVV